MCAGSLCDCVGVFGRVHYLPYSVRVENFRSMSLSISLHIDIVVRPRARRGRGLSVASPDTGPRRARVARSGVGVRPWVRLSVRLCRAPAPRAARAREVKRRVINSLSLCCVLRALILYEYTRAHKCVIVITRWA